MSAINETIINSIYRIFDKDSGVWKKFSWWGKAKDTEFDDGQNAEDKLGAINGITSSLASTADDIAASAKAVNTLNQNLTNRVEKSITTYSTQTLAAALTSVFKNDFTTYGSYSFQFQASDGFYHVNGFRASQNAHGIVVGQQNGLYYHFYTGSLSVGADSVLKKLGEASLTKVASGSGNASYLATSINGYESLTSSNFILVTTRINPKGDFYYGGASGASVSTSITPTLSYNASSGTITVSSATWSTLGWDTYNQTSWVKTEGNISYDIYVLSA